jgi:hypothetical protein
MYKPLSFSRWSKDRKIFLLLVLRCTVTNNGLGLSKKDWIGFAIDTSGFEFEGALLKST